MITIIAIGKARQSFVKEGIAEFMKRLQKYEKVIYKEVSSLPKIDGFYIALDEHGTQFDSLQFANFITKNTMNYKNLTFVIGEAQGLPQEFVKKCNAKISLSKMTFPTQLVRLIFIEQLYRAFTIIKKEPYHKE